MRHTGDRQRDKGKCRIQAQLLGSVKREVTVGVAHSACKVP